MAEPQPCPDESTLRRLMLGRVSPGELENLEGHVLHCARCGKVLDTVRGEDTLIATARASVGQSQEVEADVVGELIEQLRRLPATTATLAHRPVRGVLLEELQAFLDPPQAAGELGSIGPYRVTGVLGAGGMGVVLRAEDPRLGRAVALKIMKPSLAAYRSAAQRFLREARAAASIQHDHVVTIYEVGEHRSLPYLAMQLLEGESLASRLERAGRLPAEMVMRLARQIASGLAAAHRRGVIHRDLKPDNIRLEDEGGERVRIVDFGLARIADDAQQLTQSGALAGTPAYMAPEQVRGEAVDHRADLFALGCVFYEMCTGRAAFSAVNTPSTLMAIARHRPPAPHRVQPDVPRSLSDLTMRLLEKNPARRPQSAEDVVAALDWCIEGKTATSARRSRAQWLAATAAALVAVLLLAVVVFRLVTRDGTLVLVVDQPEATIVLDGIEITASGPGQEITLRLPPGDHELRVAKQGFALHQEKFKTGRGDRVVLSVKLRPKDVLTEVRRFAGHTAPVTGVAFSHDGRLAVSCGGDNTIRVWDVGTGRELHRFPAPPESLRRVTFSPDDMLILSGGEDGIVRLWDAQTGEPRHVFEGHAGPVLCTAFSPDGTLVLSGSRDRTVRVWEVATGRLLNTLAGHTTWVRGVAVSPDGRLALSAGNDAVALVWDIEQGQLRRVLQGHRGPVGDGVFSDDGRLALTGSWDGTIRLWDVEREAQLRVLDDPDQGMRCVALVPNSSHALAGGPNATLTLYDLRNGHRVARLAGHVGEVWDIAVSPDGQYALSAGQDHTLRLWQLPAPEQEAAGALGADDLPSLIEAAQATRETDTLGQVPLAEEVRCLEGHEAGVCCVAFSSDGSRALSGGEDATARLWDIESGREIRRFSGHTDGVLSVTFQPEGHLALSGGKDGTIRLWDPETGDEKRCLEGHNSWVTGARFSPDGTRILSASLDCTVRLWDVATGEGREMTPQHACWVRTVAFLPGGLEAFSGGNEGNLWHWDLAAGKRLGQLGRPMEMFVIAEIAVSPDGRYLAAGEWDGALHVWELNNWTPMPAPAGHGGPIGGLAFTPDGRCLLSGSWDCKAVLWEVETGRPALQCAGHTDHVQDVAVSSDGRRALTGSRDGTVRLWRLPGSAAQAAENTSK